LLQIKNECHNTLLQYLTNKKYENDIRSIRKLYINLNCALNGVKKFILFYKKRELFEGIYDSL
jgi:hypothetical protein